MKGSLTAKEYRIETMHENSKKAKETNHSAKRIPK